VNLEPENPPPYPVSLPGGGEAPLTSIEDLASASEAERAGFVVYLCLRQWMYASPPVAMAFDCPSEARHEASEWVRSWRRANLSAGLPFGAILDDPDLRDLLSWRTPGLREGIRAMLCQTCQDQGYPYADLVRSTELWPSLTLLDDLEMLCVEWVASQHAKHRTVFQSAASLTRICSQSRRGAIQLIHSWKAVMTLAMRRSKEEARAEAELQMLAAAQHVDAGPSLKANATKNIASMYGLGKEEKTESLEGQLMDLLTQGGDDEPKQIT